MTDSQLKFQGQWMGANEIIYNRQENKKNGCTKWCMYHCINMNSSADKCMQKKRSFGNFFL